MQEFYDLFSNIYDFWVYEFEKLRITSYTSRHSWATIARKHNVPISVISAGLGHNSEHTTQIYLSDLENCVVDNANRKIIKALND